MNARMIIWSSILILNQMMKDKVDHNLDGTKAHL